MHRDDAWQILLEYSKEERTRKHGIAVEATMRAYARELHEDEEKWGIVGLLHDFDWEIHPTEDLHPEDGSLEALDDLSGPVMGIDDVVTDGEFDAHGLASDVEVFDRLVLGGSGLGGDGVLLHRGRPGAGRRVMSAESGPRG